MSGELPLHPALVHLPIALFLFIPFIALGLLIFIRANIGKNPEFQKLWALVPVTLLLALGSTYAAMASGESDKEILLQKIALEEKSNPTPEKLKTLKAFKAELEEHEEHAEALLIFGILLLFPALIGYKPGKSALIFQGGTVLGLLFLLFMSLATGHHGGKLVYQYGAAEVHYHPEVGESIKER